MRSTGLLLVLILLIVTLPSPGSSQTFRLPSDQNYVGVDFLHPILNDNGNASFPTFSLLATFRHQIAKGPAFVGQIPFSTWGSDGGDGVLLPSRGCV